MNGITFDTSEKTIQDIANLYKSFTKNKQRHLNLSPGFQRESVWRDRDRKKLIDSILRNYPIPAIFLYRREENGEIVYDVIDGKQRLETCLMFMGLIRGNPFFAEVELPDKDEREWINFKTLQRRSKQYLLTGYKITTIEVNGDPSDVIELFVRINSTGKALTPAEKRNAKYYHSSFLKVAGKLANRYEDYFLENGILTDAQISRMKHVELICELMVSMYQGDLINKKAALDKMMDDKSFSLAKAKDTESKVVRTLNKIKKMFPDLYQTRFKQLSDFYSLAVLMYKFETENLILTDRRRNKLAWELLVAFSSGVDQTRLLQKKVQGIPTKLEKCREYLLTVLQATDEISQRRRREDILRGLLESIYKRKDKDRLFSQEQRRILWNSSRDRLCNKCGKPVTWADFTVDHIRPFSKGGETKLNNAAIMHHDCNSAKGNR
jgi:5-methylcytosine-specific restriction endonuclease McrA